MGIDTVCKYKMAETKVLSEKLYFKPEVTSAKIVNSTNSLVSRKSKYQILNLTIFSYAWIQIKFRNKIRFSNKDS